MWGDDGAAAPWMCPGGVTMTVTMMIVRSAITIIMSARIIIIIIIAVVGIALAEVHRGIILP